MNSKTIKRIKGFKINKSINSFFGGNPATTFRYRYVDGDGIVTISADKITIELNGETFGATLEEMQKKVGADQLKFWLDHAKNEINRPKPYYTCAICGAVIFDQTQVYCDRCREAGWKMDRAKLEKATLGAYEGLAKAVLASIGNDYDTDLKKSVKAIQEFQVEKDKFTLACRKFCNALNALKATEHYFRTEDFEILSLGMLDPDTIIGLKRAEALEKAFKEL